MVRRRLRPLLPRSFRARLTLGFVSIVAFTLLLVAGLALNRLDDYFAVQEQQNLQTRATAVANILQVFIEREANSRPVIRPDNSVDPAVLELLESEDFRRPLAELGQADLGLRLGSTTRSSTRTTPILVPSPAASWLTPYPSAAPPGQSRQALSRSYIVEITSGLIPWAIEITLSNPYSYRATTIADLSLVVGLVALAALVLAILLAALLTQRFTDPLRRLTDAARVIAGGDLSARVPADLASAGALEIASLSRQFNAMAEQVEESVEFVRRDRDRSRDFLADVSHELRTPIAALRMFNELLREGAVDDPATRTEFLESSAGQLERLDWLAQNLLELSKLDSGLVLLDLRPDDLRSAVESAFEQAEVTARKRGISLRLALPPEPLRVRHDPPRIAQVVGNLVGNALKFTTRGGSVSVSLEPYRQGARIRVSDTGVGIDGTELPHIFERFYRGSRANEARGSGSGLGLAIVRSIVDMHEGRITVESRVGKGTTFTVDLPPDPRIPGSIGAPTDEPATGPVPAEDEAGGAADREELIPGSSAPDGDAAVRRG